MVKHTEAIRQHLPTNCFSVFDHFVGLALKELRISLVNVTKSAGLVIFSEEILKLHFFFFCSVYLINPFRTNISIIALLSSFLEIIEINWDIRIKWLTKVNDGA